MMYSGGVPAPTGLAVGITDPIDCFHLFLSPDIYDELVAQTNLYADQQRAAKDDTSQWTLIPKEELIKAGGSARATRAMARPKF